MTRFEQIKQMDTKEMTRFLCYFTETVLGLADIDYACDHCPASRFCKIGHNGFEDWLNEDIKIVTE